MKLHSPFSALSTTGVDALALSVLAGADHIFSVSEVHKLAPEKASREAIRLSLIRLTQQGIASEHRIGHAVGYSLNRDHLLADAVLAIASAKQRLLHLDSGRGRYVASSTSGGVAFRLGSPRRNDLII